MDEYEIALTDAVERAVRDGKAELDALDRVVGSLLDDFGWMAGSEEFGMRLRDHLARQRDALSTYNIVFFGRTGAGKSTLLSAFGELDGAYVSPGESDWTTGVVPVDWHGCRMWDTPGINGWGRTELRSDLEERARKAVETADTVLLCFDTQSQQASEFAKVAEWVREYGKPAIAVLNVRNLRWRHPAKVANVSARQSLSRTVREHADNIRSELAKIGLPGVPIVAMQSRRALFARAATPFAGPAAKNFQSDRAQFGVDYLARWSNFPVLEAMIAASVVEGGSDLRRTALREGLRKTLDEKALDLERRSEALALGIAEQENRIEELLDVLGYVEGTEREQYLGDPGAGVLGALESERAVRFRTSPDARLSRYTADLLQSHLSGPREAALKRSDDLITSVFTDGKPSDEEHFRAVVYAMDDVDSAASMIGAAVAEFLQRELRLSATKDLTLAGISTEAATLDGGIGRIKRRFARAAQAGGLAAGAAAGAVVVPGVANIWNPAGWIVTTTAIGLGAVSQVGKYVGTRTAASAEKQGAQAKADAIRASRTAVHETYDRIEKELAERSRTLSWQAAAPILTGMMRGSLEMRTERNELRSLSARLRETAAILPRSDEAREVLDRAQCRVVARCAAPPPGDGGTGRAGDPGNTRRVLLGEDWLEEGDHPTVIDGSDERGHSILDEAAVADRCELESALARAWDVDTSASVADLTRTVSEFLAGDTPEASRPVDAAASPRTKPTVVIVGDYSSGKSSLVKRLLVELGGQVPDGLHVNGGVATESVQIYDLGHIRLVDTPGLQGGNPDHERRALDTVSGAALVLIVLHVNLLIGDLSRLEAIVKGSPATVGKGRRTIYLINRSDELGVDPLAAPEDFVLLKKRKEAELVSALGSRGIDVDPTQVHTLAGDPFGEIGTRTDVHRGDYDPHRSWDGVTPLVRVLETFSVRTAEAGSAGARLDDSLRSLLRERDRTEEALRELRAGVGSRTSLLQSVRNSEQDGQLLDEAIRGRVRRAVEPHVSKARERVLASGSTETDAVTSIPNSWWDDPSLESDLDRVVRDARDDIEEWFRTHASVISREMESAGVSSFEFHVASRFDGPRLADIGGARIAVGLADKGMKLVQGVANRDAVYQIGKAFNVKFKPWGAVNTAGKLGKVAKFAPVVAAAGVALDGFAMAQGEIAVKDREKQRRAAADFISGTADRLVNHALEGDADDGLIPALRERMEALTERAGELEHERADMLAQIAAAESLLSDIDRLLTEAETLRSGSEDCEWQR